MRRARSCCRMEALGRVLTWGRTAVCGCAWTRLSPARSVFHVEPNGRLGVYAVAGEDAPSSRRWLFHVEPSGVTPGAPGVTMHRHPVALLGVGRSRNQWATDVRTGAARAVRSASMRLSGGGGWHEPPGRRRLRCGCTGGRPVWARWSVSVRRAAACGERLVSLLDGAARGAVVRGGRPRWARWWVPVRRAAVRG